ncbi:hypothetical protein VDBG_06069 [Verticillium alfalfae VaMs.102]|uniref:C3H1-type domain-containing protein n=1 Tax=Verticillium alfalfae (strain VaMs.102 / ATCC MYA-4576 / FGSC 10136) TaxID=526221 RepID=C9SME5_VERA1|nr:hypothetical protein VDBG_06069 [Verticillium alfalfae VaMs.102]EEY19960.1 hypothetical protein VDBG_06069 [Verticillium alfalfae VaMs.102]
MASSTQDEVHNKQKTTHASSHQAQDRKASLEALVIQKPPARQPTPAVCNKPVPGIIGIKPAVNEDQSLNIDASLRPTYFLMRPGPGHTRCIVPLIPLDLLPQHINITGLPRYLSPAQTSRMSSVGTYAKAENTPCYELDIGQPSDTDEGLTREETVQSANASPERVLTEEIPRIVLNPVVSSGGKPSPPLLAFEAGTAATSAHHHHRHAQSAKLKAGRGNYCRHYCHHGTCKWGSRCRYQHIMPSTSSGLAEVGLKNFPAWYRAVLVNLQSAGRMHYHHEMQADKVEGHERGRWVGQGMAEHQTRGGNVEVERLRQETNGYCATSVAGTVHQSLAQQRLVDLD